MSKENLNQLREQMVTEQLIPRGISDKLVLNAMRKVPRHKFMPKHIEEAAYEDNALPIGEGQTISQPYMVAIMTEKLGLKGGEKVLEIGTGSGYQAAILAEIAKQVYSIDKEPVLADRARKILSELGYKNIEISTGDGTVGLPDKAPFDAIIVTAGAPSVPKPLIDQLSDGGRLVIPVGEPHYQILTIVTKRGRKIDTENCIGCVFVPLVGKFGWK